MRIMVIGAGPIGLLCGGWLQCAGAEVCFVARGTRLEALRSHALTVSGQLPFRLERVEAVASAEEAEPADLVLLGVKMYDLASAAQAARAAVKPDGVVAGLQNGVSVYSTLRALLPPASIAVGIFHAPAKLTGPTSISYAGAARIVLGNPHCAPPPIVGELIELWRRAGVDAQLSEDINLVLWTKFLGLATNAALTCLTRLPAGILYHDPDLLALTSQSIEEVIAVGRAEGIRFAPDAAQATLALLQRFPPDTVASMRQDLDAGKRLELEAITGEIVRLGRKHAVPTPLHSLVYTVLKPYRDGPPVAGRSSRG